MDDDDGGKDELGRYIALCRRKTKRWELVCPECESGVPVLEAGRYVCPVCCRVVSSLCELKRGRQIEGP